MAGIATVVPMHIYIIFFFALFVLSVVQNAIWSTHSLNSVSDSVAIWHTHEPIVKKTTSKNPSAIQTKTKEKCKSAHTISRMYFALLREYTAPDFIDFFCVHSLCRFPAAPLVCYCSVWATFVFCSVFFEKLSFCFFRLINNEVYLLISTFHAVLFVIRAIYCVVITAYT